MTEVKKHLVTGYLQDPYPSNFFSVVYAEKKCLVRSGGCGGTMSLMNCLTSGGKDKRWFCNKCSKCLALYDGEWDGSNYTEIRKKRLEAGL
jgi:hypothetical protein